MSKSPHPVPCLQKDVEMRAEASTVSAKIQSFIPGNLIVVSLPLVSHRFSEKTIACVVLFPVVSVWRWLTDLVGSRTTLMQL